MKTHMHIAELINEQSLRSVPARYGFPHVLIRYLVQGLLAEYPDWAVSWFYLVPLS
jgi:hypothetical protein